MSLRIEMKHYGPPEVLEPVERPDRAPGAGEVAVRVAVAGVNRADCFIRSGEWQQGGGWPYTPGLEACGVVESIGSGVRGLAPGDRVITMMQRLGGIHGARPGGYQQRLVCPADTLAPVPAALDLEAAGALGLPAVTAVGALEALDARAGQRVLVTGATSAVGVMAIQLLAAAGCHAIAGGRRTDRLEPLRALGAAELVATADPAWRDRLDPVDRVFDLIGSASFAGAVDGLAPGGRLVFVGGTSGGELAFSGWALMRPVTLTGYSTETLDRARLAAAMERIAAAAAAGALRVPAVERVPLAEAARAHRMLEAGANAGRVLLVP
ncbi:MAG TPA: zinc-binding alcohol dehydrogenase family protein [Kofleriaceae bacterium]|nr:zinc-binding alcohol dehydrogenase family protein [Kofleriaceae bacterium]